MLNLDAGHQANLKYLWRRLTIVFLLLVALATVFSVARDSSITRGLFGSERYGVQWAFAIVWFVIGVLLIQQLRRTVTHIVINQAHSDMRIQIVINRVLSAVGYAFVLVVALHLLQIQIGSILVGGAVTGVIVGVGAQSTLSNLFAGMILFTLRPFNIGQYITIRTYLFGGAEYSGTVEDVNWYHTVLNDVGIRRILPNASIIASAITVSPHEGAKLFNVPLPYSTSFRDFEQRLRGITNDQVALSVKEFSDQTYTVQVQLLASIDVELVREAIAEYRTKSVTTST